MSKTAFVTGAGNGLGRGTAEHLAELGYTVFAADFDEVGLASVSKHPRIHGVRIDVTSDESVDAAFEKVAAETDGLDAVVNFAGILAVGSMVEMPIAELQRVLDVNVLGTARVNRRFFPLVHARKGRIVNISSETGWQSGAPFNGAYATSKHAIEAYSDSLRREMDLLGMHVIKIQPGPFRTNMVAGIEERFERAANASTHFAPVLRWAGFMAVREANNAHDPAILAGVVAKALAARNPKAAYSVRPDKARAALEWLPVSTVDAILRSVLGKQLRAEE